MRPCRKGPQVRRSRANWAAAAAAISALLLLASCSKQADERPSAPPGAVNGGGGGGGYAFSGLAEMAAASDLVVKGTITDLGPGRVIAPGYDGEAPLRFAQLTLAVERVFTGSPPGDVVMIEDLGYADELALGYAEPPPPLHLKVGDIVVAFVAVDTSAESQVLYYFVSSQSQFVVSGASVIASDSQMPWVKALEALSPAAFEQAVEQAVEQPTPTPSADPVSGP